MLKFEKENKTSVGRSRYTPLQTVQNYDTLRSQTRARQPYFDSKINEIGPQSFNFSTSYNRNATPLVSISEYRKNKNLQNLNFDYENHRSPRTAANLKTEPTGTGYFHRRNQTVVPGGAKNSVITNFGANMNVPQLSQLMQYKLQYKDNLMPNQGGLSNNFHHIEKMKYERSPRRIQISNVKKPKLNIFGT